jgi:hypothetical protein
MNCTIPVLTIDSQDCVGDSLGKHNYNALALDTSVCNLSSLIYGGTTNVATIFNELSSIISSYQDIERTYDENKLYHILTSSTTVNLLSSFWGKYTFSVEYPMNSINLPDENLSAIVPVLSTVNTRTIEGIIESRLKTNANSYLLEKYNPNNFPNNTIVNVVFFLYNLQPNLNNSNNRINDAITKYRSTYPSNGVDVESYGFSMNVRTLYPRFHRDDVHLTTGVILKYIVQDYKWVYIGYVIDDVISNTVITDVTETPATTTTTTTNVDTAIVPTTGTTNQSQTSTTDEVCDPLTMNKFYVVSDYKSSRCFATGTSKKHANARLTFYDKRQPLQYSYTASGYNAAANSGGTDIWIEFDAVKNRIKVYEQNPGPKKLVKTEDYIWGSRTGITFRYDSIQSVSVSSCGVKKTAV